MLRQLLVVTHGNSSRKLGLLASVVLCSVMVCSVAHEVEMKSAW